MDPCDDSFTFVLRIWCEPREVDRVPNLWRGVIEHIPDGERRYVRSLEELDDFLIPFLEQFGVRISLRWRARRLLGGLVRAEERDRPEQE
jgi:hypothetical protein